MIAQIVYGINIKELDKINYNAVLKSWKKSSRISGLWLIEKLRLCYFHNSEGIESAILCYNIQDDDDNCWNRLDIFSHIELSNKRLIPPSDMQTRIIRLLKDISEEPLLLCPIPNWHLIVSY